METELGSEAKVLEEQTASVLPLLRVLTESVPRPLHWRSQHGYMLVDAVDVAPEEPREPQESEGAGAAADATVTLTVRGYLRGVPLTVHDLVHVTAEGTHTIAQLRILPDPAPLKKPHARKSGSQPGQPGQAGQAGQAGQPEMEEDEDLEAEARAEAEASAAQQDEGTVLTPDPSRVKSTRAEAIVNPEAVRKPNWPRPPVGVRHLGRGGGWGRMMLRRDGH